MLIRSMLVGVALLAAAGPAVAQAPKVSIPKAVTADPAPDAKFPARMEVLHIPSGGVEINGVALVASGEKPHPVFVLFHGLPGNEKNLDLAQAVRRAGWTVVTINYRGSWGSPGKFSFAQNVEDARNTLAYIRQPEVAKKLNIDPTRIAIGGHSMGGWVTVEAAAAEAGTGLLGAVTISTADLGSMGTLGKVARAPILNTMKNNMETLAGVTPDSMTDEVIAHGAEWSFDVAAPKLKDTPLLVLYSKDGLDGMSKNLVAKAQAAGAKNVASTYVETDHGWSDKRIMLQALVINWLQTLRGAK